MKYLEITPGSDFVLQKYDFLAKNCCIPENLIEFFVKQLLLNEKCPELLVPGIL
jgi:hypothetical protein